MVSGRVADRFGAGSGGKELPVADFTYTDGECPQSVIRDRCAEQCPDGYRIAVHEGTDDFGILQSAVNQGIDSHLEAAHFEEASRDEAGRRVFVFTPDGLGVLCRRFREIFEANYAPGSGEEELADSAHSLRGSILTTLGIEEI